MRREEIHCEEETWLMKTVLKGVQGLGCARVRARKGSRVQRLRCARLRVRVCKGYSQGVQGLGCTKQRGANPPQQGHARRQRQCWFFVSCRSQKVFFL